MDEQRPNPNMLLQKLRDAESRKSAGMLKIFFGYSAGVGKTFAMLEEAHGMQKMGVDVVIGYVEPHQREATSALFAGLPSIPPLEITYKDILLHEFDIDSAIKRKPKIILVDELAHTNAKGCRHAKRYQDVEELLRMGIDVYTTVNVQHIEGLHDVVESITGVAVRERVPDHVFDRADKIELVDIDPEDLIHRLNEGKIYTETQAKRALGNFFTKENLIALREITLRRMADRVNITVETNKNLTGSTDYYTAEHILMCLSSSPSNAKVVRTAAKMAEAFHSSFTALFVETSDFDDMSDDNTARLNENLRLAKQLGAKIVTVYGDDVAYQVAEYAKISGVSKIVLGRPANKRIFGFAAQNYVDRLISFAPNLEVFVIPNKMPARNTGKAGRHNQIKIKSVTLADTLRSCLCLVLATLVGFAFHTAGIEDANIITVYILASLFTAVITEGKIYSVVSSLCAVLLFNFFFTEPLFSLDTYNSGYSITFVVMFLSAFITSTFTNRVKELAKQTSLKAYRTEILFDTILKLQQAKDIDGVLLESIRQVTKLLNRPVVLYPAVNGMLVQPITADDNAQKYVTPNEGAVAQWVFVNNKHAGAGTHTLSGAQCVYFAIRSSDRVFAVIGIAMGGTKNIDAFEKNILIAMLGECAMALEREHILEEKNNITIQAQREQLRSSLLRAISHDLRTPLTGIAGGSSFLLESLEFIDTVTAKSILTDISNDAVWLSNLVENLLNMTRIQEGNLTISKKNEVVEEVISEALAKVLKRSGNRAVNVEKTADTLLVPMDAQLMIQVIINLLDNAFKYTNDGTEIDIHYGITKGIFELTVSDNGSGIPEDRLDKIFEPFFTSSYGSADKQRGMGLGLSICKSIVEAHGGGITAENNESGGARFIVTLPMSEAAYE